MKARFRYLFTSTRGLVLLAIGLIGLVTAIWSTQSGPMVEWGVKDLVVRLLGMKLVEAEREGRIISLYHSIAMAVVSVLVYLISGSLPMRRQQQANINATVTVGYLLVMFNGLIFGYWGQNWVAHGLFLFGQALVFYAGLLLTVALWPFGQEHRQPDPNYSRTRGGIDLERVAFFIMAVCTLGSAVVGALAGAYFGNGFVSFLSEDTIRYPSKTWQMQAVIGHLHIMLTLIAVATALMIGRWFDFKGILHRIAMPLVIVGTIITTLGAWSVIVTQAAHVIIYVGSTFVMFGALLLVIYGWSKLIRERLAEQGIAKATFSQKLKALVHDPLRFGSLWQMVFMNFTVSGVGIFMAVKLDEIIRVWPHRDERITLAGHWHILSALTATIILFYFADTIGLRGKARQWFGWTIIIGSDLAFASATIFSLKRLFVSEYGQQLLVNRVMLSLEIGLAAVLIVLAIFLVWRLADLFKRNGHWSREADEEVSQ